MNPNYNAVLEAMKLIDEPTFAHLCDVSVTTAAQWRYRYKSPAFISAGNRIFYRLSDVEAWLVSKTQGGEPEVFKNLL